MRTTCLCGDTFTIHPNGVNAHCGHCDRIAPHTVNTNCLQCERLKKEPAT